jgi:hypothetical protein
MRPSDGHAFVSIMMIPVTTKRRQAAFTLLELMVSAGLSALILGMIMYCFLFASRSFVAMGNYIDLNNISEKPARCNPSPRTSWFYAMPAATS